MPKGTEVVAAGGVLPALASGKFGDENRGFAAGFIPGLLYRDRYKDAEEERQRQEAEAAAAASAQKGMKKGGKVKSASARADGIAIRGKTRA